MRHVNLKPFFFFLYEAIILHRKENSFIRDVLKLPQYKHLTQTGYIRNTFFKITIINRFFERHLL
jgi:hypothetical protein